MALPKEFWEQLPLKSDEDLYDMLAHPGDYLPEALAAAREELGKRNLPPEKVAQLEAVAQSHKVAEEAKSTEPLGWPTRVLIFLFCAGLSGAILAFYYESKEYKRKAHDCWITLAVALAVYVALGFVLFLSR